MDHALPSRAPKKRFNKSFCNKAADAEFDDESRKPIHNGFLYRPPNSAKVRSRPFADASSSSTDDEGYETPSSVRISQRLRQKRNTKIPTLKRKVSEWERNEKRSKF